MSFGPTKLALDLLRDGSGTLVERSAVLRSGQGGLYARSTGTLYGGSFTERGPPLELPSPLSGFGPTMGGAAGGTGPSGGSSAPLLAVIVPCLIALMCLRRFCALRAFLRPEAVSRLALERPG